MQPTQILVTADVTSWPYINLSGNVCGWKDSTFPIMMINLTLHYCCRETSIQVSLLVQRAFSLAAQRSWKRLMNPKDLHQYSWPHTHLCDTEVNNSDPFLHFDSYSCLWILVYTLCANNAPVITSKTSSILSNQSMTSNGFKDYSFHLENDTKNQITCLGYQIDPEWEKFTPGKNYAQSLGRSEHRYFALTSA